MMSPSIASLSDRELLSETKRVAETERRTTAELVSLLAEVDSRKLYLGEGYSSLFTYCTTALRLSEQAAYSRITAARATRRFPVLQGLLRDGTISLTTVGLLAPHLTDENHERVLDAAQHKSKREVERLVAAIQPQPDIPSSVRALAVARTASAMVASVVLAVEPPAPEGTTQVAAAPPTLRSSPPRSITAPIAPHRYLVRMTVSEDTHRKLERARDLLRHQIPDGDPAAILDLALTLIIDHAERVKFAATPRPLAPGTLRRREQRSKVRARRIPADVRRTVWVRDEGRCAFVGEDGRCAETGCLEFHHLVPFATGGASDADNLQLRCRAHNAWEAAHDGLAWRPRSTRSGPS